MFRELSDMHDWTPAEIGAMTLPQVMIYLAPDEKPKRRKLTPEEFRALCRKPTP